MLKKSFIIAAIVIAAGYCYGEDIPGNGTPEPISTAMIGTALVVLAAKKIRRQD